DRLAPLSGGVGKVAAIGAGLVGPAVAAYTGVLIADTAVPTWHAGFRELPFVFVGSAAAARGAGGRGPCCRRRPPRPRLPAGPCCSVPRWTWWPASGWNAAWAWRPSRCTP